MSHYNEDVLELLQLATFLDPRFKTKYINDIDTSTVKGKIQDECCLSSTVQQGSETNLLEPRPPPAKKRNLSTLFKTNKETEDSPLPTISKEQCVKAEVNSYTSAARIDFKDEPLVWWKCQATNYPFLSDVARKYLCVCATSSPSERLFRKSGQIVTPLRATLKPERVNMLTFLLKNVD